MTMIQSQASNTPCSTLTSDLIRTPKLFAREATTVSSREATVHDHLSLNLSLRLICWFQGMSLRTTVSRAGVGNVLRIHWAAWYPGQERGSSGRASRAGVGLK
jgi:hypothetical protein